MSVSFGPLCAAATATGGNEAPFNREGREAAHKSLDPRGGGEKTLRSEFFLQVAREKKFRVMGGGGKTCTHSQVDYHLERNEAVRI